MLVFKSAAHGSQNERHLAAGAVCFRKQCATNLLPTSLTKDFERVTAAQREIEIPTAPRLQCNPLLPCFPCYALGAPSERTRQDYKMEIHALALAVHM